MVDLVPPGTQSCGYLEAGLGLWIKRIGLMFEVLGWKLVGYIEVRRNNQKHLASIVKVKAAFFSAGRLVAHLSSST